MGPVCVIGAGSAGLAAAQALAARGMQFTVFEAGSAVGGNWRYENDSGRSSAYASLEANTSRRRTSFRCFPMPRRGALFPGHAEMLAYLEAFTDHFALRRHIRFSTTVSAARPLPGGGWEVTTSNGGTADRFSALLVATGYNAVPQLPDLPGTFGGLSLHSHDYRTPEPFAGRDVVVVGLGCSATDIACDLRGSARSVTIAARSGCDITARRLGPVPLDWFDTRGGSRIPWSMRRRTMKALVRLATGDQVAAGLPAPPDRLGDKPFSVCDDVVAAVRRGEIRVTGAVESLHADRVVVEGGEEVPADAVIFATGYRTAFDFLPEDLAAPRLDHAPLYRGVASPDAQGLFFVGLVAGHGALIPMFEAQAAWVADVLAGRLQLPSPEVMRESIARDAEVRRRDFDPRYDIFFDRWAYVRALESESRRARRRPGRSPRAAQPTLR